MATALALLFASVAPVGAQLSLDAAIEEQLDNDCNVLKAMGDSDVFDSFGGPQLREICGVGGPSSGGGLSSGGGAATSPSRKILKQRLLTLRESDEKNDLEITDGAYLISMSTEGLDFDSVMGINLFAISSIGIHKHEVTRFESAYKSDSLSLLAGIDIAINDWSSVGLAFGISKWDGEFDGWGNSKQLLSGQLFTIQYHWRRILIFPPLFLMNIFHLSVKD